MIAMSLSRQLVSLRKRQRGAVLITSLLILLILTLIGVAALTTTTLQERMAGNARGRNIAFQAAEAALRDGEADVLNNRPSGFDGTCTNGLCLPSTNGTPVWESFNWANWRTYGQYTGSAQLPGLTTAEQPRYIIEKLPLATPPGSMMNQPNSYGSAGGLQYYRVTARGTDAGGKSVVVVQSVYFPGL